MLPYMLLLYLHPKCYQDWGIFHSCHIHNIAATRIHGFEQPTKTTYVSTDILQYLH